MMLLAVAVTAASDVPPLILGDLRLEGSEVVIEMAHVVEFDSPVKRFVGLGDGINCNQYACNTSLPDVCSSLDVVENEEIDVTQTEGSAIFTTNTVTPTIDVRFSHDADDVCNQHDSGTVVACVTYVFRLTLAHLRRCLRTPGGESVLEVEIDDYESVVTYKFRVFGQAVARNQRGQWAVVDRSIRTLSFTFDTSMTPSVAETGHGFIVPVGLNRVEVVDCPPEDCRPCAAVDALPELSCDCGSTCPDHARFRHVEIQVAFGTADIPGAVTGAEALPHPDGSPFGIGKTRDGDMESAEGGPDVLLLLFRTACIPYFNTTSGANIENIQQAVEEGGGVDPNVFDFVLRLAIEGGYETMDVPVMLRYQI